MVGQRIYSSLPGEDSLEIDKVKAAVLGAYELEPEAHCQRFCRLIRLMLSLLGRNTFFLTVGVHLARLKILNSFDIEC